MKKYRISGLIEPRFTYNTYPTWWRRLFNKPIVKTTAYYHKITLVFETDVPLNHIKYKDGNVIGPFFEDVTTTSYITPSTGVVLVEPGGTNLLINTASTLPNL